MQFQIEDIDYGVRRFFDLYQNKLPVVVMVTQGFYGDIVEDTFDREQMLIINAISKQNRVVAKCELQGTSKLLSIPDDYSEKLCKIKYGIVSEETKLNNILRCNSLPFWVQFPPDRVLTVGNKSINTDNIPPLNITKRFDEVNLLGNALIDGQLCTDIIHVPLYLSKLRLSVATGIKGHSADRWRVYFENLVYKCSAIKYHQQFGNPNIAEYDPSTFHSHSKISYLEPKSYSSIISLVDVSHIKTRPPLHVRPRRGEVKSGIQSMLPIQTRPLPPLPEEGKKAGHFKKKGSTTFFKQEDSMYLTPKHQTNHFPKISSPVPDYDNDAINQFESAVGKKPPLPTPRVPKSVISESTKFTHKERPGRHAETKSDISSSSKYQNDIPRALLSLLSPTVRHPERYQEEVVRGATSSERVIRTFEQSHKGQTLSIKNVKSLSIDEVNEYLHILNLSHFGEKFRENMIDGTLLIELTENMLRDVFGMNKVEALRLLKFAREGYIPGKKENKIIVFCNVCHIEKKHRHIYKLDDDLKIQVSVL